MTQLAITESYSEAIRVIELARINSVRVYAVWSKLDRVANYLNAQAAIELQESLN